MERTETGFEITPECADTVFTVIKPAEKGKTPKGKYYYIFRFAGVIEGAKRRHSEVCMTWMAGDILKGLGCKEEKPGVFLWDKTEIVGKQLIADIVHEPDFKDPDKPAAKMKNIRPVEGGVLDEGPEPPAVAPPAEEQDEIPF